MMWYLVQDSLAIDGLWYNFMPSWWRGNYGVSFGERIIFDPDYRVEVHRFMARTLTERLPELHIGSADAQPEVILPDFGNAITAALAGCEVVYPEDNYPWNRHLAPDAIERLVPPEDIAEAFPYSEIARQVAYLNSKLGLDARPSWKNRGVLNDAALIGGTDFFAEFAEDTPTARHLLDYCNRVMTMLIARNGRAAVPAEMAILYNCMVMMVSAGTYRNKLLAYDQNAHALSDALGQSFGIHHCGNFERYAATYRTLPRIDWFEIGWGSDIRTALEQFPETTIQYILSAVFIASASRAEVRETIAGILDTARGDWHRFRLTMPDIECGTPDDNLREIYACCKEAV
jgi:hypothetical protein